MIMEVRQRRPRDYFEPDETRVMITAEWHDVRAVPTDRSVSALVKTAIKIVIPHGAHQNMADRMVYDAVEKLWLHELHEHFMVDGKHFIDPHPSGGGFQ